MGLQNETIDIYEGDRVRSSAWRRPPEFSEWKVSVAFGDSGWDVDPGVYMEPLTKAIAVVSTTIQELVVLQMKLIALQKD